MNTKIFVTLFLPIFIIFLFRSQVSSEMNGKKFHLNDEAELHLSGIQSERTLWPEGSHFEVETRKDKLKIKKCSNCHENNRLKRTALQKNRKSHWNIELHHAGSKTMNCTTCHSSNVEKLKFLNGKTIGINHAYKVCQQCHFQQAKDWAGGAHGKRLSTWAGRRIVRNCTGCHNPHQPKMGKRWPKINVNLPEGH